MPTNRRPGDSRDRVSRTTPKQRALSWWAERAQANRYVIDPAESPSPAVTKILRQDGHIMEVAGRRVWILIGERPPDRRAVFLANYWAIASLVLDRFVPAAIAGIDGVRVHLGDFSPPENLLAYHAASKSELQIALEPGFSLRLRPRTELPAEAIESVEGPGGATIPVLSPADILATLDESEILSGVESITAWLRHLVIRGPELDRAILNWPRPVVLQRLADIAGQLKNKALADQLDSAAARISQNAQPPARTGVGTRIQIPTAILEQPRGSGSAWLDEQLMRLERQREEILTAIGDQLAVLARFPIAKLLGVATETKAYDAYHSTTMEGYRITPETVDAIVRGDPRPDGPQDQEALQSAMAVQGYSAAFDRVLRLSREKAPISASLILDLYEDLFRPSVDAGVVTAGDLRGWRTSSVGLRGWRHVPPNPRKVPDLVRGLESFAARKDLHPITRALLVHLEFVTIHPFVDGNGRLGRLLMNLTLMSGGLPWVTIRSDERIPFFRAIESAQVLADTNPYIHFVWHQIRQALANPRLASSDSRRGRGAKVKP